jgi:hypothetical protein
MPIFYSAWCFSFPCGKSFFFYGRIGTGLRDPHPPSFQKSSLFKMTSKKNRHNNVACEGGHCRRMCLMAQDSLLLTGSDLGRPSRSRSCSRSPWGAGHGSRGNGVTHPPNRKMTKMTSPPSGTSPAPSGTDLASNPTTTSTMIRLPAKASSATQPPQAQDAVLVYTVTSSTDLSKPSSAATTPTTVGTCSYLKAVSPASGLCVAAPAFTPVGVNLVDKYTRSGAEGRARNAPEVSQGAVSPSSPPLELAMEANRTGATEADALYIPPSLASGGALALSVSPFGGALASSTLTSRRAPTLSDGIQAVAPLVSGSPPTPPPQRLLGSCWRPSVHYPQAILQWRMRQSPLGSGRMTTHPLPSRQMYMVKRTIWVRQGHCGGDGVCGQTTAGGPCLPP